MAGEQVVPEVPKADLQVLLQDFAQARRDLFEERRNSERAIAGERERARWEIERVRTESAQKVKNLEAENEALTRALARLQMESDRLREENAVLRHSRPSMELPKAPPAQAPAQDDPGRQPSVALGPGATMGSMGKPSLVTPTYGKVSVVPPQEPPLGKSVPVAP